jgi:3-deoxy-D-manno-octulosonic acid kinase
VNTRTHKKDSVHIVYDADCIRHPDRAFFEPEFWQKQGAVVGVAAGRGRALLLETEFGPAVLRQYLRGGWAARVSRDRYAFSGYENSRPVREYEVLEQLFSAGLPVPRPIAALCAREGRFYSGWLMTRRIMDVLPLADVIGSQLDTPELWRNTGACIRRFHDFGAVHADLNARNILVGENAIHLIDFDRSRLKKKDSRAFSANLRRLHRSLQKVWPKTSRGRLEGAWNTLLAGYDMQRDAA